MARTNKYINESACKTDQSLNVYLCDHLYEYRRLSTILAVP